MRAKYMEVYYGILGKMERREYIPLSKLPSEGTLMEEYGASRDTIRKALALLVQNGYIQKSKGKAAVVLDYNSLNFPVSGLTTFTELANYSKMIYKTYVEDLRIVSGDESVMNKLDLDSSEDAHVVVRVREIDGEKIIIDKDIIKRQYVPVLTKEICQGSIYAYFEKELGLKISFARKEITVRPATEEDKRLLDMNNYDMVVIIKSKVYLEDLTLFQFTESRHRPDKFIFTDFARRTPVVQ